MNHDAHFQACALYSPNTIRVRKVWRRGKKSRNRQNVQLEFMCCCYIIWMFSDINRLYLYLHHQIDNPFHPRTHFVSCTKTNPIWQYGFYCFSYLASLEWYARRRPLRENYKKKFMLKKQSHTTTHTSLTELLTCTKCIYWQYFA